MIRSKGRMRLCVMLLAVNLLVIWGNSLLPGELSGAISRWVKDLLSGGSGSEQGHGLLRKLGHFTEFTCLGLCLTWLMGMLEKRPWLSLTCGFLAACADETIQRFVPDRGPSFRDVLIDTTGVAFGIILLLVGHTLLRKRKQKKLPLEENTP